MALRLLCAAARNWKNYAISNGQAQKFLLPENKISNLLKVQSPIANSVRSVNFLNKITGAALWKGCTSVSNAGKKRGRGKLAGKGLTKDLNRGQIIGNGRRRLSLPGLNAPVKQGNELMKSGKTADDPSWSEKLYQLRDMHKTSKRIKISHMERGYSGTKLAGRSIGAPDPIGQLAFDGFDARCLEMKIVNTMRGNLGRFRRHSCFVATGNGQGVLGFAIGKSTDPKAAIRKGKNRAAQKLMHFELCDGRTIYHDFFSQFGPTKVYAYKMPEGFGHKNVHRVIRTLCNLIGIKDLRVKVEGSKNPHGVTKAFLVGLLQQKSFEQLAEDKKLFVVEFDGKREYFPRIVGIPSVCRTNSEVPEDENRDFKQYVFNGKLVLKRPPRPTAFANLPSYQTHLKRIECKRGWAEQKQQLLTRYGELRSFLTDKYPEATGINRTKY